VQPEQLVVATRSGVGAVPVKVEFTADPVTDLPSSHLVLAWSEAIPLAVRDDARSLLAVLQQVAARVATINAVTHPER
jgi:hypothetical protein